MLLPMAVFAGGADVSQDEIYSDGLTLTIWDGSPLDIDGDGNTDLAVAANRGHISGRSRYYLGNGDGTFQNGVRLNQGASSEIVLGDLTGDAFLDLVQGRRDMTDLLYIGDGLGAFLAEANDVSPDQFRVLDVAVGDLDGDGDLDIVMGNGRPGGVQAETPQINRYYLNDGTGNFTGADIAADADDTRSIALADIDGDGHLDIIVGNDETTPGSNLIYRNQTASGTFGLDAGVGFGPEDDQTAKLLIGDLNADSMLDIVVLNHASLPESPGINRFYLNQGTAGTVQMSDAANVSGDADNTGGGVLADFDGDGDLDIAVVNLISSTEGTSARNRLYLNQFVETGSVSFSGGVDISADEQMSRSVAATDLNGDGHIDLVVGNQDGVEGVSGRDRRYLNNGTADPFTNVAPVIDSQAGPLDTGAETAIEILLEHVEVSDPDNVFPDDFTLAVQPGDNYTVNGNSVTPDAGFSGDLAVSVVVNDGSDDSEPFDLTVSVSEEPGTTPSFTSTPIETATEGVEYRYDITATDPNGDPLVITAPTLPDWLTFEDNGDGTATLTGTPAAGDVGEHDVVLEVSDGTDDAMQAFTITVAAASSGNTAPAFTSTAVVDATEGEAYSYEITATDDDGDALEITAPTLPGWLTLTDNGDGTATLSGTPGNAEVGEHSVALQVSDGSDTGAQEFTLTVEGASDPAPNPPPSGGGGGGGSLGLLFLLALASPLAIRRPRQRG